jgi:hypothetical protein
MENKNMNLKTQLQQFLISRVSDENNFVVTASMDMSYTNDKVNVEFLLKRWLRIIGSLNDLVTYVQIGNAETTQGSMFCQFREALTKPLSENEKEA